MHTHDTSGNGIYLYAKAIEAGVDIVDTALGSMAGLTSQPSANSLYYALKGSKREVRTDIKALEQLILLLGRCTQILSMISKLA